VGSSYTFTVLKNGSSTALQIVISDASTSGTDTSNSVSFAPGDTVSLLCVATGTPATLTAQSWNFQVTTSDLTAPILSGMGAASTSVTNYGVLTAGHAAAGGWNATETNAQIIVPTSGTLSKLYARMNSTPGTSKSYQFTLVKNGTATALDLTIAGASSTGTDLVNSVSVSAGDTLTIRSIPTGTPNSQTSISFGMVFTPTTPGETFFGFGSSIAPSTSATQYEQVSGIGNLAYAAGESGRTSVLGPYTLKKIYASLGTAPGGAATRTITIRKAGANTGLAVTFTGAATTGNTAADVTYTQGDTITLQSTVSGGPAADVGGVHMGVLIYAAPTITAFTPIVMVY